MLLRFFDVEAGRVLIDGQDVRDVNQESLRRSIGMVTQDPSLLHRSIRENILYGRTSASEEELLEATRKAHASGFIQRLEDRRAARGSTPLSASVVSNCPAGSVSALQSRVCS